MKCSTKVREERSAARANRSHEARRFVDANEDVPWRQRSRSVPARGLLNGEGDKPEGYTATLKKLLVPTFEEQLKKGVATYYGRRRANTSTLRHRRCACVVIT